MNREINVKVTKAANGFIIRSQRDVQGESGQHVATDAAAAKTIANDILTKALTPPATPAPTTT